MFEHGVWLRFLPGRVQWVHFLFRDRISGTMEGAMADDSAPFPVRFGHHRRNLILQDFPTPARVGLLHVFKALERKQYVSIREDVMAELARLLRASVDDLSVDGLEEGIHRLPWENVFVLCERAYGMLRQVYTLNDEGEYRLSVALVTVQAYYTSELNQLLKEEAIGYEFSEGRFVRPGRPITQRLGSRAAHVLAIPELAGAAGHYRKAQGFFNKAPDADFENAVKESVAALEAAARSLFPDLKAKDLPDVLRRLQGTGEEDVPTTLGKIILGLYEFRGAADGVAHGGAKGGVATAEVAELALNVSASAITYLADLQARREFEPAF
jgi:hypothetical protein